MPAAHAVAIATAEYEAGLLKPAAERTYHYQDKPVEFIQERLGEFMWSKQREIAEAVEKYRRVAVKSCHESGKSWTVARLVAWWLSEHPPGTAFVVTTAPSARQVRAVLWREIARAYAHGKLGGRLNQTEWWMDVDEHEEMVAFGSKPSDTDPAAFQGIHARYVLVVLDEADGVPESLYHAARSLTANEESRIIAIGNPDDPSSYFCRVALKPGSGWHVIHIDGYKTPNLTGEEVPDDLRHYLISETYIEEMKHDVGEAAPMFISKVRGEVPEETTDGVIPISWLKRCMEPRDEDDPWPEAELLPVEFGVDVGAGGDLTVVRERRGRKAGRVWRARTPDPAEALELVMQALSEAPEASAIKIDAIGIGWGLCGMLEQALADVRGAPRICPVNVGTVSLDPTRFPLLRDQLWWDIGREFCRDGVWDLSDLDEATQAQLIAPRYRHFGGRVKIEPKDDTRKRLGRSPDDADALLLAFYDPPEPPLEGTLIWDDPVGISPV